MQNFCWNFDFYSIFILKVSGLLPKVSNVTGSAAEQDYVAAELMNTRAVSTSQLGILEEKVGILSAIAIAL